MKLFLNFLSFTGLVVWFVCFTLGYNFSQGGALVMSIVLGVALIAVMGLMLYLMKRWSRPLSGDHVANAKSKEIISLVVYLGLTVLSVSGVAQFIKDETSVRTKVRPLAEQRMHAIERVFGNASVSGSYLAYVDEKSATLENNVKADFAHQGLTSDQIDKNAATQVNVFESNVVGDTYQHLASEADNLLSSCSTSIGYWNPFTLTDNLSKLDTEPQKWIMQLKELSQKDEWSKNEPYEASFISESNENLLQMVTNPEGGVFNGLSIVLIVVIQIIILLSYLAGRDWDTQGGRKPNKNVDYVSLSLKNSNKPSKSDNSPNMGEAQGW